MILIFLQILRKIHTKLVRLITYSLHYELFSMKISKTKVDLICLTLYYLLVTKRSHMLKQTCSWKLQVCLSMSDFFLPPDIKDLKCMVNLMKFGNVINPFQTILYPRENIRKPKFFLIVSGSWKRDH